MGNPLYFTTPVQAYYSIFCDLLMMVSLVFFIVKRNYFKLLNFHYLFFVLFPLNHIVILVTRLHDIITEEKTSKLGANTQWFLVGLTCLAIPFQLFYSYTCIVMFKISVFGRGNGYDRLSNNDDEDQDINEEDISSGWFRTFSYTFVINYILHMLIQTCILLTVFIMRGAAIESDNLFRERDLQIWVVIMFVLLLTYTIVDNIKFYDITDLAILPYITFLIYSLGAAISFYRETGKFEISSVVLLGLSFGSIVFKERLGSVIIREYKRLKAE